MTPTICRAYAGGVPVVIYSLLRLGLFAAALIGLWAVGMGGWLLVLVAAVVAWALSYVLLGGPRTAAATWIAQRRGGADRATPRPWFGVGASADAAIEDAADDDARHAPEG